MKKTVIINIGNTIIHIEEDAYETLTSYLKEIKQHFSTKADDVEIVTDIENRLAEMFAELLAGQHKQVIDLKDVQTVITQMGRVQDFEETGQTETAQSAADAPYTAPKKLFRDTEQGIIAGVCAGLGHYFGIEYRWIRLIAFLSLLLGGTGVIVYIILWIAMPPALTRMQKMGMKGEVANLFGYKRSFEEELMAFKNSLQYKKPSGVIKKIVSVIGQIIKAIVWFLLKMAAFMMMATAITGMVLLVIFLGALWGFWTPPVFNSFPFSVVEGSFRLVLVLSVFLAIFIPLLVLVLLAVRVAFNKKSLNKTVSFALLFIWLAGLAGVGYYTAKITAEFQEHASLLKTIDLKPVKKLYINAEQGMGFSNEDSVALRIKEGFLDGRVIIDDGKEHPLRGPRKIRLNIEKSEDGRITMTQKYESQGKTFEEALQNAQNIHYRFYQKDSLLMLSPKLDLKKKAKWRRQTLEITLRLPVGIHIMLNNAVFGRINTNFLGCEHSDDERNAYTEWAMTKDGFKCLADIYAEIKKKEDIKKEILAIEKALKNKGGLAGKLRDSLRTRLMDMNKKMEELKGD